MTLIGVIEGIATILWVYALAGLAEWVWRLGRAETRTHVGHVAELLLNLVPVMVLLIATVMVGSIVGLPSVVVFIAVLFPSGLAYAAYQSLNDMRRAVLRVEVIRLLIVLIVAAALIYWRNNR